MADFAPDRPVFVPKDAPTPPARPGVRHVPLPAINVIIVADDRLRHRVDRRFHLPMIILALSMLPPLVIEFWLQPAHGTPLWWINWVALTLIWIAFFIEFVVKVTIAECRFEYCKRNWLDILILMLPALRMLRIASAARTSRLFTLRGVGMKFARSVFTVVIGLEATDRVLHRLGLKKDREGRKPPEKMTRHQLIQEIRRLRAYTDNWEDWYVDHLEHLDERGVQLYLERQAHLGSPPALEPERYDDSRAASSTSPIPGDRDGPENTISPPCESPSPN